MLGVSRECQKVSRECDLKQVSAESSLEGYRCVHRCKHRSEPIGTYIYIHTHDKRRIGSYINALPTRGDRGDP